MRTQTTALLGGALLTSLIACGGGGGTTTPVPVATSDSHEGDVEDYDPGRQGTEGSVVYMMPGKEEGTTLTYEELDGLAVFEGDIILGSARDMEAAETTRVECVGELCTVRAMLTVRKGETYRWPGGVIPYVMDPAFTAADRTLIEAGIAMVDGPTHLTIKPRVNERDYVNIKKVARGCSASVGRQGFKQPMRISPACSSGNVAHEFMHVAGAWHEQSRTDRNDFIDINWSNVKIGKKAQFFRHIVDGVDIGDYDYDSIMHYSA